LGELDSDRARQNNTTGVGLKSTASNDLAAAVAARASAISCR